MLTFLEQQRLQVTGRQTIDPTFKRFEVLHGHSQHSELVQLPGHWVTSWNHG